MHMELLPLFTQSRRAAMGLAVVAMLFAAPARADSDAAVRVALELGPSWISRNDIRIPGDTGTRFDMRELTGDGPDFFARVESDWQMNDRHGVRLTLAPLEVSGAGSLSEETDFAGESFQPGTTRGSYQFSTYKLTYRYTVLDQEAWRWRVGFTALIRDAEVELRQGPVRASDDDVGVVPLLHLAGSYRLSERWLVSFDFDGLAGGPGRAFDAALKATYRVTDRWRIGGGYRTLEGGVDTDDVYSFGWIHYGVITVDYRLR